MSLILIAILCLLTTLTTWYLSANNYPISALFNIQRSPDTNRRLVHVFLDGARAETTSAREQQHTQ